VVHCGLESNEEAEMWGWLRKQLEWQLIDEDHAMRVAAAREIMRREAAENEYRAQVVVVVDDWRDDDGNQQAIGVSPMGSCWYFYHACRRDGRWDWGGHIGGCSMFSSDVLSRMIAVSDEYKDKPCTAVEEASDGVE
jgi:hypothetical protein